MMQVAVAAGFDQRPDPGLAASLLLAVAVHVLLAAILLLGVRWQSRPPESVVVELWRDPPPPPVERVEPPKPVPVPEAAPVEPPKPEPRIEKPDIAIKELPRPKPRPEVKPKPVPKARVEPVKPKPEPKLRAEPAKPIPRDAEAQRRLREELAREQTALAVERERQTIKDQLARDASAARNRGLKEWEDKVRAKIRGNVVLPQDIKSNPEAIFDVVQLPTGEVLSVRLRKSSGHKQLDEAIERAILKSSPLPKPDRPELFMRSLELKYRPLD